MTDDMRRYLQEQVLGKCWHESDSGNAVGRKKLYGGILLQVCKKCGAVMSSTYAIICTNRTFTTRDDMMDLYQALWKADKWLDFERCYGDMGKSGWLFCLFGHNYEERCRMVYKFLKGEK